MNNSFSSPNVQANEVDQSFNEADSPQVGGVLMGTTPKGPAYRPTLIRNFDQFREVFGDIDPVHPVTLAAYNYLKNSNSLRVVRILGDSDGTAASSGYTVGGIIGISDVPGGGTSTGSIMAQIHHTGIHSTVTVAGVALDANRFTISFGSTFSATASFQTASADYIEKVLNTDPTKYSTYGHYLSSVYRYQKQVASASWFTAAILSSSWKDFLRDYEPGVTPYIKSQPLGGVEFDLFRIYTTADGRATNDQVKVTVANIRPSPNPGLYPYGTFDIVVRDFYDNDIRPIILENHTQLSLDPADQNYILRRIGDIKEVFDDTERKFVVTEGSWVGKPGSRHIRVQLNEDANFPPEALPFGFRGFQKARFSGSAGATDIGGLNLVPTLPYSVFQRDHQGNYNGNVCWGVNFVSGGIADRMRAFPDMPVGDLAMTASDADFSLKGLTSYTDNGTQRFYYLNTGTAYQPIYTSGSMQKFTIPFKGGFDGWDLRVKNPIHQFELANTATETNIGVVSIKRAVDTIRNPDFIDANMLAIPGVHNKKVTDYARNMVNERKDMFYVMDVTGSTVSECETALTNRELDDNYTAAYYPDLKMEHPLIPGKMIRVPASVGVVGAIAYTDRVAQPFFAPAGLNRGGLGQFGIKDVVDRLNFKDRDRLYDAKINPIGFFTKEGVVIYGQKTLQARPSALDRVNVRRLLILAKKQVMQVAKELLFEPNNGQTWQNYVNKVNPILDAIRRDQGLERFRVVMDSTTTTPDLVDKNAIFGKIILQPTKTAEYISIDFVVTNSGVSFSS